ncbi:TetR family transcriptional regulator [Haloechinothrix sp. YIM 98757]|uniref:TetR family transcriptional regulator n=1 Tax=Haloechinothrix aidingensis TaxID=2752311 RepID=A0A838A5K4_9PSEU|nr:TetR family transcriptional regulator [Haloechinothrix aidingensis]MBA0124278.1 TetR family transcriptional regulator [Haloechinothrix aidingensis]
MSTDRASARKRGRSKNDPGRPRRIVRAAIMVIAEHGVEALTHRKVAEAADVPLGSTTYYFTGLDQLVEAAMDEVAHHSVAQLREWERNLPPDAALPTALADFVVTSATEQREYTIAEHNLYTVSLHRPSLRSAAAEWDDAFAAPFIARTDSLTGRMLGTLTCGLQMQVVLREEEPDRDKLEAFVRRALVGSVA